MTRDQIPWKCADSHNKVTPLQPLNLLSVGSTSRAAKIVDMGILRDHPSFWITEKRVGTIWARLWTQKSMKSRFSQPLVTIPSNSTTQRPKRWSSWLRDFLIRIRIYLKLTMWGDLAVRLPAWSRASSDRKSPKKGLRMLFCQGITLMRNKDNDPVRHYWRIVGDPKHSKWTPSWA